jgi:hypothetical protein
MASSNEQSFVTSTFVRHIDNEDGAALLDVKQGLCFSMNPVGLKIWGMLRLNQSIDQITHQLVGEFGLPEEQLRKDVIEFVENLKQSHLLILSEQNAKRGRFDRLLALVRSFKASTSGS